jgi:hypothetical protein
MALIWVFCWKYLDGVPVAAWLWLQAIDIWSGITGISGTTAWIGASRDPTLLPVVA